ncbi:MAG: zinc ribbon domain-containing protein [Gaiellaceae bacterium]
MGLFSRSGPEEQPAAAAPRTRRRAAPPPGDLRRERKLLLKEREARIRDLGGLVMEMYRQDSFREHLLYERSAEIAQIEERLLELELLLDSRRPPAARCECGAPIFWGSHFCANCGRQVGEPLAGCPNCGSAVPAAAGFCPICGAAAPRGGH